MVSIRQERNCVGPETADQGSGRRSLVVTFAIDRDLQMRICCAHLAETTDPDLEARMQLDRLSCDALADHRARWSARALVFMDRALLT